MRQHGLDEVTFGPEAPGIEDLQDLRREFGSRLRDSGASDQALANLEAGNGGVPVAQTSGSQHQVEVDPDASESAR